MTYSPTTWQDLPNTTTPLTAARLNNMEAGIVAAYVQGTGGLLNADIGASAAIAYSKLNLALGIVNADISASAAILYSKLNLASSIVNADISASAAIAASKLATDAVPPAGGIMAYGGSSAPTGWVLCDGSSLLRASFAALFTAIGTAYGSVDGTHFTVPDLQGRIPVGKGTNAAVNALAASDGVTVANRRPQHRHTAHTHIVGREVANLTAGGTPFSIRGNNATLDTSAPGTADGGSGTATDSLDAPAYLVVNYIIKT